MDKWKKKAIDAKAYKKRIAEKNAISYRKIRKPVVLFSADSIANKLSESAIFDLSTDPSTKNKGQAFLSYVQVNEFLKKYDSTEQNKEAQLETECFQKFRLVNEHMGNFGLPIDIKAVPCGTARRTHSLKEWVLLRAKHLISATLRNLDMEEWFYYMQHGPGTTIGVNFIDTSSEAKWNFPITMTAEVKGYYDLYKSFDPELFQRIRVLNENHPPKNGFGPWIQECKIVSGSRATTVPKTSEKRRFIAIEPTFNMYLQQGLMTLLYDRLKEVGLDITCQEFKHQELARESSVTFEKATIDFSSASDCVSSVVIEYLFPYSWAHVLLSINSKQTSIEGESVKLNMFATMGNATTFPIETLIFWAIGAACIYTIDNPTSLSYLIDYESKKEMDVFGDDCIMPTRAYELFLDITRSIGFIVNEEKTFYGPYPFRESCGGDYFDGYLVRPFYLRAPVNRRLSSLEPWLYVILNELRSRYIMCLGLNGWYNSLILQDILHLFSDYGLAFKFVPGDFPLDAGYQFIEDLVAFWPLFRMNAVNVSPIWSEQDLHNDSNYYQSSVFYYCCFKRTDVKRNNPFLLYREALKKGLLRDYRLRDEPFSINPIPAVIQPARKERSLKKRGGYIVAKALSSFWTLPGFSEILTKIRKYLEQKLRE